MAMTTREFVQHLLLNCDLDDPVYIEVIVDENTPHGYVQYEPAHATKLDGVFPIQTLIECKPLKE